MLEGLEAAEILFSQAVLENSVFRIDSQYFKKQYLLDELNVHKYPVKYLGELAFITDGQHGYHEVDDASPIRHLTAKNASGWFANDIGADRIAAWVDENNKRSSLQKGDLILSTRGTVGCCAIIDEDVLPANIDQDVARIKLENFEVSSTSLLAFINSTIGQDWMERNQTGMVQQGLALWRVREMPIPIVSKDLQGVIDQTVLMSKEKLFLSTSRYKQAETLLLDALNLTDFSPSTDNTNAKSFQESFGVSGRLDAEYYQPKYDQLCESLGSFPGGVTTIGELADQIANGAEVREYQEEGVAYLRVGDLKNLTIDASSVVRIDPVSAEKGLEKIGLQTGDVLVSRSGSLAVTAVVEPEWADSLISSHLIRLRITDKRIDPYYLALFLGVLPGKMQIQQQSNGGVQPEINQPSLKSILVPIPPQAVQKEIRRLILNARELRDSSNNLLETAKCAVEIAIEQDEAAALHFINQKGQP